MNKIALMSILITLFFTNYAGFAYGQNGFQELQNQAQNNFANSETAQQYYIEAENKDKNSQWIEAADLFEKCASIYDNLGDKDQAQLCRSLENYDLGLNAEAQAQTAVKKHKWTEAVALYKKAAVFQDKGTSAPNGGDGDRKLAADIQKKHPKTTRKPLQ